VLLKSAVLVFGSSGSMSSFGGMAFICRSELAHPLHWDRVDRAVPTPRLKSQPHGSDGHRWGPGVLMRKTRHEGDCDPIDRPGRTLNLRPASS
jgi:hypothetical protein